MTNQPGADLIRCSTRHPYIDWHKARARRGNLQITYGLQTQSNLAAARPPAGWGLREGKTGSRVPAKNGVQNNSLARWAIGLKVYCLRRATARIAGIHFGSE